MNRKLLTIVLLLMLSIVLLIAACSNTTTDSNAVLSEENKLITEAEDAVDVDVAEDAENLELDKDFEPTSEPKEQIIVQDIDVYEQNKKIGRAINLGNALDAPYEGAWDLTLKEEYFKLIKDQGFDSLRVPIRFSNKTTKEAPYTINESFMKRVDWVIEQGLQQQLNVIIDLHHFDELTEDPAAHKERLLAIWQQISERYYTQSNDVYYEILNEPHTTISARMWNEYLIEVIDVIRSYDPNRTLIVGGTEWNSIDGLYRLQLPENDRNIIATFHYYGPMFFTHQGAEWMGEEYHTKGLVWPGPPTEPVEPNDAAKQIGWVNSFFNDYNTKTGASNPASKEALIKDLERAARWGEQHDRPIFLGEFGAYRTADLQSRTDWTRTVRTEAERLGMSWAYWEFAAGFGVYNRATSTWNEELLQALLGD